MRPLANVFKKLKLSDVRDNAASLNEILSPSKMRRSKWESVSLADSFSAMILHVKPQQNGIALLGNQFRQAKAVLLHNLVSKQLFARFINFSFGFSFVFGFYFKSNVLPDTHIRDLA